MTKAKHSGAFKGHRFPPEISPFSAPFNASGQPAIVLPVHQTADGLPVASQIVGRLAEDALVLQVAAQIEAAQPFRARPA